MLSLLACFVVGAAVKRRQRVRRKNEKRIAPKEGQTKGLVT
jgi:hypothetical protein